MHLSPTIQAIASVLRGTNANDVHYQAIDHHLQMVLRLPPNEQLKHIRNFGVNLTQRYRDPYFELTSEHPFVDILQDKDGLWMIDYGNVWLRAMATITAHPNPEDNYHELNKMIPLHYDTILPSDVNFVAIGVAIIGQLIPYTLHHCPLRWPYDVQLTLREYARFLERMAKSSPLVQTWIQHATVERLRLTISYLDGISVVEDHSIDANTLVSVYAADDVCVDVDWSGLYSGSIEEEYGMPV